MRRNKLASALSCFINPNGSIDYIEQSRHAEFCMEKLIEFGYLDKRYLPKKDKGKYEYYKDYESDAYHSLRMKSIQKYCELTGAIKVSGEEFYVDKLTSKEILSIQEFIKKNGGVYAYPYKNCTIQEAPYPTGKNKTINTARLVFEVETPSDIWSRKTDFGRGSLFASKLHSNLIKIAIKLNNKYFKF